MDSVGFTVGHNRELFPIGGVEYQNKQAIRGYDSKDKPFETRIVKNKCNYKHSTKDKIPIGTTLTYVPTWEKKNNTIKTTSIDDRVGLFMCLILAKTLKHGILIFSCGEEIESGNVPFLVRFIHEKYHIHNTLVLDATSEHKKINILMKHGPVISLRDEDIPDKAYVQKIIDIAKKNKLKHQLEITHEGSSDGRYIKLSPYIINWAFIGPPIKHIHTHKETIYIPDIFNTIALVEKLFDHKL